MTRPGDDAATIRCATADDVAPLIDVICAAFKRPPDHPKMARLKAQALRDPGAYRVLFENGRLVGALHVRTDELRIGASALIKGDVGEVAIAPDRQGEGLGSVLLRDTVEWMRGRRYDLSRLGGRVAFYSRFGYHRFARRYVEFPVGHMAGRGANAFVEAEIALSEHDQRRIVPFDAQRHADSVRELLELAARQYAGAPAPGDGSPGELSLVYEEDGRAAAYVLAVDRGQDITEFEARIGIERLVYDPGKPHALQALVAFLNNHALSVGAGRISARIPFDSRTFDILAEVPVRFYVVETYGGRAANMLQVINLRSLAERMAPEWEGRLRRSPAGQWRGVLAIDIGKQTVLLRADDAGLSLAPPETAPDVRLAAPERVFLQLLLGLTSFVENEAWLRPADASASVGRAALAEMFPRRLVHSGNWG